MYEYSTKKKKSKSFYIFGYLLELIIKNLFKSFCRVLFSLLIYSFSCGIGCSVLIIGCCDIINLFGRPGRASLYDFMHGLYKKKSVIKNFSPYVMLGNFSMSLVSGLLPDLSRGPQKIRALL
jgi:hypothetical protein